MNHLYHKEAFEKLLTHRLHEEIKSRHDANKKLSKADFELMEENIKNMTRALKKEEGPILPNESISRLTIESWYRHKNPKAKVSASNFKILCSFLEGIDIEYSDNPKEQGDLPNRATTNDLKKLEGKTYWSYNRFMGTENTYKYGHKKFKIGQDELIRSLFTFGKVFKGNKIHVRRKTSLYDYEGDAYILGNIIYMDLQDAKNPLNFERNSYMGRIDNLHELPIIKCLRLCLVNYEPRAVRLIMVEVKGLDYDKTLISEGNNRIPINLLDKSYSNEIIDYLGDFSNVTLSPTPLTINDMLARIDSLYNYIYKRWTVTSKFIQNNNILIEPVESDTFEIDITHSATLLDFYTHILDEMNGEHAMYFTSIASREYLWNNQTMNLYGQAMHNFIDRGGKIVRFFFVNNLDNLSDEQKKILIEHYNIYGKVNDDSAVYITDEKRLPVRNNKLICVEKNKMAISWEATAERNKTGETEKTGGITKIKATINQGRIKSRIEIMDYLEECGKKPNSKIVRKIGMNDIEKWEKELTNT